MAGKRQYPWPAPKKAPQPKPKFLPPAAKPKMAGKPSEYPSKASGLGPQTYGGPVVGRLQPRLPDPAWLNKIADESDERLLHHRNNPEESRKRAFSPALPIPGLPPPPASSLGSRQQMQAHFRSFSPEHRRTAIFSRRQQCRCSRSPNAAHHDNTRRCEARRTGAVSPVAFQATGTAVPTGIHGRRP